MRNLILLLIILNLIACAPRRPAKVDEIGNKPHRSYSQSNSRHARTSNQQSSHVVVKGDSLYSIGFKHQIDYKTLAAINNINPPYRIYPKQVIKLQADSNKVVFKPTSSSTVQTKPISNNPPIVAKTDPIKPATTNKPATDNKAKPVIEPTTNQPKVTPTKPTVEQPTANKPMVITTPTNTDLKWLWPTQGNIRTTFLASNPARKGISIGGKEGQDVKATEAGVVVYSGNGLLGYGELIIIKHNDSYLSAYGHNKVLKVKEGQTVTRGQVIAELGSTGTNVNNLHFEIRKNGQPVNPLNYVKP